MPIANHDIFLRGQAFQSNRAAYVDLVGADADFRAQSVFKAIGETGGGVDHHRAGIHFGHEAARAADVFAHDRFGMPGTVLMNMLNRLGNVGNHADR